MVTLISPAQEQQVDVYFEDTQGDSHYDMVTLIIPAQELQVDVYLEDAQGDSHYDMVALIILHKNYRLMCILRTPRGTVMMTWSHS